MIDPFSTSSISIIASQSALPAYAAVPPTNGRDAFAGHGTYRRFCLRTILLPSPPRTESRPTALTTATLTSPVPVHSARARAHTSSPSPQPAAGGSRLAFLSENSDELARCEPQPRASCGTSLRRSGDVEYRLGTLHSSGQGAGSRLAFLSAKKGILARCEPLCRAADPRYAHRNHPMPPAGIERRAVLNSKHFKSNAHLAVSLICAASEEPKRYPSKR